MDASASSCPTCGTPRGHYDRFCTGCGEDLGAPGALLGTLIKGAPLPGTSSGAARARAPIGPGVTTVTRPGVRTPPAGPRYAPTHVLGAPVASNASSFALTSPSTYRAEQAGERLWRTIAITNRLIAVFWLAFFVLGTAVAIGHRSGTAPSGEAYLMTLVIAGLLPAAIAWLAAPGIEFGSPSILRPLALIEMLILIPLTLGLILVPIIVIFVFAGGRPAIAGT